MNKTRGTRTRGKSAQAAHMWTQDVHRASRALISNKSVTTEVVDAGKFCASHTMTERYDEETGNIEKFSQKDRSQGARQFLDIGERPVLETMELQAKQLDKVTGRMVPTSDTIVLRMMERTLLKRGNPFLDPCTDPYAFKRTTSRRKMTRSNPT